MRNLKGLIRAAAALGLIAALHAPITAAAPSGAATPRGASGSRPDASSPLPPPRPDDLRAGGAAAEPAAAPSAQGPRPTTFAPLPAVLGPPISLPPASRERMHACGAEWQQMKLSGAAADKTWRDFAMICLTR